MILDWYGTCPKCKDMGWCDYKGKVHIKDGPESDTYKVLIYKCKKCGKKFGFLPQNQDLNNLEQIAELLGDAYRELSYCSPDRDYDVISAKSKIIVALNLAEKHCGDGSLLETENKEEDDSEEDWNQVYFILNDYIKHHCDVAFTPPELYSALDIARKHRGCNS